MHLFLRFIASALALYLTVMIGRALGLQLYLSPGSQGVLAAALAAVGLGIVNAVIRPILTLLTLPITCLTLGLFSILVNAFCFWLVGQFIPGFHVRGFIASLFGTIVMGFVGGLMSWVLVPTKEKQARRGETL